MSMLSFDDALTQLLAGAKPVDGIESLPTMDVLARVLASPQVSAIAVPSLDNSSMDGYAVRSIDIAAKGTHLTVAQRIPATLNEKAMDVLQQLSRAEVLAPYRTQRLTRDGSKIEVWITATALLDEQGQQYAVATTERGAGHD